MRVRIDWMLVELLILTYFEKLDWLVHKCIQRTCAFNSVHVTNLHWSTNLLSSLTVNEGQRT